MIAKTWLYWLTLIGLYFELIGSFLLTAEAIGETNLKRISDFLKSKRLINFLVFVIIAICLVTISKLFPTFSQMEALLIILSLGIFIDFAPKFIEIIMKRLNKGTAGLTGFFIFAIGFCLQAYVSLILLK
jgi:uncharacterized membrane protein